MKVTLMSGTGNTFFFIDGFDKDISKWIQSLDTQAKIKNVINEISLKLDFEADGIVFILPSDEELVDFRWDFYNKDGSAAEMCGNAARCAIKFYANLSGVSNRFRFKTIAGIISGEEEQRGIKVEMTKPEVLNWNQNIVIKSESVEGTFMNTGVPHFVILRDFDSQSENDLSLVKEIRNDKKFSPQGTNVTLYKITGNEGEIDSISFERGVENWTLACGTGAVAAAIKSHRDLNMTTREVKVNVPGGCVWVQFTEQYSQAFLIGDVKIIDEKEINLEGQT